jgi:hypothetical protein
MQRPLQCIVEGCREHFAWSSIWEKHKLERNILYVPFKTVRGELFSKITWKPISMRHNMIFFSLHELLKEQISSITHTLIYNQFYFGESIQNPSYSNLANIIQNLPKLHASSSSCFTSWNLWSCVATQGFTLSLHHVIQLWIFSFSASLDAIHHRYENLHGDLKELSASKFNDHIRDRLNNNSNKASFMSKW